MNAMKQQLKKKVYHCHRVKEGESGFVAGFDKYLPPIEKWLSIRSVSGEAILVTGGELNNRNLICKLPSAINDFSENDRCYIGVIPPQKYDFMCNGADYRVVSVLTSFGFTEIIFERVVGNADLQG